MHTVILLFVALFPIIPAYFKIVGFTASNILCTLFVICYFLSWDKKETLALQKLSFYILAWFFCCSMIELIHDYQITTPIFLLVRMVAIFFLLPNKINTRERFLSCIDAVICISAVVSVLGIVEEITNLNVFELLNTSGFTVYNQQIRFGIRRIVSFASQTISYCVYQIFIGALIFYRITLLTDSKKKKWFQVC